MLYLLFEYLHKHYDFPGLRLFQYLTFRASLSIILSLFITTVYGRRIIDYLHRKQVGDIVRNLGLEGQMQKQGTPTMGGIMILLGILIPTLLFANITNIYVILMIITTVWMGVIGFIDDYIKVFKKNKEGLAGRFKVVGQVGLAIIVGLTMFYHPNIVVRQTVDETSISKSAAPMVLRKKGESYYYTQDVKSTVTNMPFYKNNEFDYAKVLKFLGQDYQKYALIVFMFFVITIVTAVSNGANLTDGIDGLATGTSAIIGITLGILAYVSGNTGIADYLNIMYIPNSGELIIFAGAFVGACVGFLWYNSYPAQIFMGDIGSLTIGGIIAVFAVMIRKELLIPIMCGIFLVEVLSVTLQVSYFKSKIVIRFWIIGIMLAVITFVTLKLR
ncbi:MAG: phospho-N-acetylmuramoyl-pentapeptide-transferase [Chitinophagaceae bacterium]|nr:MAG: phospho-N-acetylmuramoyl-pentapeptide-transferase [Chitinophagaceae bacterium]